MPVSTERYQAVFHRRWNHLHDPHVRTLAWLLDAPDLLDAQAPQWHGRVATLGAMRDETRDWLNRLDRAPKALHNFLALQPFTRLGRYAEKLMAFYLEQQGRLVAHGVQVRAGKNETIGEFDFLLREEAGLVHWEFATKLYLLESSGHGQHVDYFVGPNLADTLGAKTRKIMDRQLSLSRHPAARAQLPEPVVQAQALVKGWLFYHGQTPAPVQSPGVGQAHCRGFWCTAEELDLLSTEHFMVLPRLSWLAPARAESDELVGLDALKERLSAHFTETSMPELVAVMAQQGDYMLEIDRGFVVPGDWRSRAGERVQRP
jgi:hypothetical protein